MSERMDLNPGDESLANVLASIERNMDPDLNTALLIDDERGIRKMVARSLKDFAPDMQIFEASNGKEGLEALAKIRKTHSKDPLLIVLDLNMPIMNGWEFVEILKNEYEAEGKSFGIPIIVLSSTSGEKGVLFMKKSVHGEKSGYNPIATVAKESCVDKSRYDAKGGQGLDAWLKFFLGKA
ncbi:MAG: response regulator [Victivallales bacterium]|nr:response regulator [Victivallales bacterium]